MIQFRIAEPKDTEAIAHLHALNWQTHYQGNFNAEYLDGPVFDDRLAVWKERFSNPEPGQYTLLAETKDNLCGFMCLFLDQDAKWGTYIDNLHVSGNFEGQGIGKMLMAKAGDYIRQHSKMDKYYLWVLTDNNNAIAFYKRVGGEIAGREIKDDPSGGRSEIFRVVWEI